MHCQTARRSSTHTMRVEQHGCTHWLAHGCMVAHTGAHQGGRHNRMHRCGLPFYANIYWWSFGGNLLVILLVSDVLSSYFPQYKMVINPNSFQNLSVWSSSDHLTGTRGEVRGGVDKWKGRDNPNPIIQKVSPIICHTNPNLIIQKVSPTICHRNPPGWHRWVKA